MPGRRGRKKLPYKQAHIKYKFLLLPGNILSAVDGGRHYVSSGDLKKLYGVHASECRPYSVWVGKALGETPPGDASFFPNLIHLKPRLHGDYAEWLVMMVKYWREKLYAEKNVC